MATERKDGLSYTTLDFSQIATPPKGMMTISSCPGFCKENGTSDDKQSTHLDVLLSLGVDQVVALTPDDELERLGLAAMPQRIKDSGIAWRQVPVVNFSTPEADQLDVFMAAMAETKSLLDQGQHVLVHCRGGTGRAGKVAAVMLIHYGVAPDQAITMIRQQREGCIQTDDQEQFVRDYIPMMTAP